MGVTPTWALPYPEEADTADVPVDMQELATRLETVLSQIRASGSIPGEVKLWPGSVVPALATYGHWVWADGTAYVTATYPLASANIATAWRTAFGQADPGAANFRVPDLRGLTPAGMDAMPGGADAGRIARATPLAGRVGEELHTLLLAEIAAHAHSISDPSHAHGLPGENSNIEAGSVPFLGNAAASATAPVNGAYTGITGTLNAGGGGAHENMQPTVFVPYIVKLDD